MPDRRGCLRAGRRRSADQERRAPPDLAGQPAQQDQRLLRRDRQVPRPRHHRRAGHRHADRVADLDLAAVQRRRAQVDQPAHQPAPPRSRVLDELRAVRDREPGRHQPGPGLGGVVCGRQPVRHQPQHAMGRRRRRSGRPLSRSLQSRRRPSPTSPARTTSKPVPVELGPVREHPRHQCRPAAAVHERCAEPGARLQHAASLQGQAARRRRHLRAGFVVARSV